jgi:hypothetical protein
VAYWHLRSSDPAQWEVVINESRGPQWETYAGGFAAFLLGLSTQRRLISFFPDDFPGTAPTFEPAAPI